MMNKPKEENIIEDIDPAGEYEEYNDVGDE